MGAWWRMRLYLNQEKYPYGEISQDQEFSIIYDKVHHYAKDEYDFIGTWSMHTSREDKQPQLFVAQVLSQGEIQENITYQKDLLVIQATRFKGMGALGKHE